MDRKVNTAMGSDRRRDQEGSGCLELLVVSEGTNEKGGLRDRKWRRRCSYVDV